jgi:hypothetical protein
MMLQKKMNFNQSCGLVNQMLISLQCNQVSITFIQEI